MKKHRRTVSAGWLKGLSIQASHALINYGLDTKNKLNDFITHGGSLLLVPGIGQKANAEILSWTTICRGGWL